MKRVKRNGISWFLDDDSLVEAMDGLAEEETTRRRYSVRQYGGKEVFVKYFLEEGIGGFIRNRLAARGKKEYRIGKKMIALSIPTPVPLGFGIGARGSFVIEELVKGKTFKSAFDEAPERRGLLLDRLALLLARLRDNGVKHNDLHLENIVVTADRIYLIDLHKTTIRKSRFSRADEVTNLAHALAMIYEQMTEEEKGEFFRRYGEITIRLAVEAGLVRLQKRWVDRKRARAFSTTSKLIKEGDRVYVRDRQTCGRGKFAGLIKKDKKVCVERYSDHIRKIYRNKGRLTKAWGNHVILEYLGLAITPRPFFVQTRPLGKYGFIAMEDLGGQGEELDRFLDRTYDEMDERERRHFIGGFSRFLVDTLRKDIFQRDFKACNVFVLKDGFRFLDVEDIRFSAPTRDDMVRMLVQLNLSVPERIVVADRLRFFLNVARPFSFSRKHLLAEIVRLSSVSDIIYEGVAGLKKETWRPRRQPLPSPFSRPPRE